MSKKNGRGRTEMGRAGGLIREEGGNRRGGEVLEGGGEEGAEGSKSVEERKGEDEVG
jgi:hypothetical protein